MRLRHVVFRATTRISPGDPGAWGQHFFLLILLSLIPAACTSPAPDRSPPIPAIKTVAIESKGPTRELKTRFGIAPGDSVVGRSGAVGAGVGAAAGLGWAAACGPYFYLCALAVLPYTTYIGTGTGALAGAASDEHKTPPDSQLLRLDKQFAEIHRRRQLHMDVRDSLERQIPADRLENPDKAEALVELSLSDIRFIRTFSNKYQWTLKSIMVVTWNRDSHQTRHSYEIYEYTSRALPLDDWLQDDGELLDQALDDSVAGLAGQMAAGIPFRD